MTCSVLYHLNEFPTDKDLSAVGRVLSGLDDRLMTIDYDPLLYLKAKVFGLKPAQVFNIYDYIQGAVGYKDRSIPFDMRVLPRYDKSHVVFSSVDKKDDSYLNVLQSGIRVGDIHYFKNMLKTHKFVARDAMQQAWFEDIYDVRGFLSKRIYYNPDGKIGLELYYHVSGVPVLEVSHMKDDVQYRLLGTCGFDEWIVKNEYSLVYHLYSKNSELFNDVFYTHESTLNSLFDTLQQAHNVISYKVAHVAELTDDYRNYLSKFTNVCSVNSDLALVYRYHNLAVYSDDILDNKYVTKDYQKNQVIIYDRFTTNEQVEFLFNVIKGVHANNKDIKFLISGYFTPDTHKVYESLRDEYDNKDNITVLGNILGNTLKSVFGKSAVGVYLANGNYSNFIPELMNSCGLPVISTLNSNYRGARLSNITVDLAIQAILLGLKEVDKWHEDVLSRYE